MSQTTVKSNMPFLHKFALAFAASIFVIICSTGLAVWLNKQTAPSWLLPVQRAQVPETPVQQVYVPSTEEKMEAVMRGFPNALKICYDEQGFLLYYGPLLKPGDKLDTVDRYRGWKFVDHKDVPLYRLNNNTWFTVDFDTNKWVDIYPDVTGLDCKDRK